MSKEERMATNPAHLEATKQAAKEGVYEALSDITGFDLNTIEGKARVRGNFKYLDDLNGACQTMKKTGLRVLVTTGVSTILAIFYLGIKQYFK